MDDKIYKLTDLEQWDYHGTALAVLGHPIHHSLSPLMHNSALEKMAKSDPSFASWRYFKFDIRVEELAEALPLFYEKGFLGLNLTLPHKVEAVKLLKDIDDSAKPLGAVNTLLRKGAFYKGFNTDGFGFQTAAESALNIKVKGSNVLLLGAGGASRAIAVRCLQSGCKSLWIGNRSPARLDELLEQLLPFFPQAKINTFLFDKLPDDLSEIDLLVNATSLGLKAEDVSPFDLDVLPCKVHIYDTTYGIPTNQMKLLAEKLKMDYSNGLGMLIWQGVRSLEIWSESSVPVAAMEKAAFSRFK